MKNVIWAGLRPMVCVRICLAALCASITMGVSAQGKPADGRPIPPNWQALKNSKHPEDMALATAIEKMKWWDECIAWGIEARKKTMTRRGHALRDHLLSQQMINGIDLGGVTSRRPAVGQTACGVYAAMGLPDKVNTSENASRTSLQIIYRAKGMYVYAEGAAGNHNGVVRSISY